MTFDRPYTFDRVIRLLINAGVLLGQGRLGPKDHGKSHWSKPGHDHVVTVYMG